MEVIICAVLGIVVGGTGLFYIIFSSHEFKKWRKKK